jgi:hypothetical protein
MQMRVATVVTVVAVVVAASSIAANASGAVFAGRNPSQRLVAQILGRVLPGAQGIIRDDATLQITLPPGSGGSLSRNDTPVWRASLAADELALRLPELQQWTIPGQQTTSFAEVRQPADAPHLDALTLSAARRQLTANLSVLRAGLPTSAHLSIRTTMIPLALTHRRFAFSVDVSVRRLSVLDHYLGDLLLGPGTGLTGGEYLIEGEAVVVHDSAGHLLGAWGNARGASALDYGPGGSCLHVTLAFRDRHGRPPPAACHG